MLVALFHRQLRQHVHRFSYSLHLQSYVANTNQNDENPYVPTPGLATFEQKHKVHRVKSHSEYGRKPKRLGWNSKVAHDFRRADKLEEWNQRERQQDGLEHVQYVVEICQLIRVEEGDDYCWDDCDRARHKYPRPDRQFPLEKAFHDELTGICSSHRGTLSSGKQPNSPDVLGILAQKFY